MTTIQEFSHLMDHMDHPLDCTAMRKWEVNALFSFEVNKCANSAILIQLSHLAQ